MEKPLQLEVFTEILKPCICKIAGPPKNELSDEPDHAKQVESESRSWPKEGFAKIKRCQHLKQKPYQEQETKVYLF